MLQKKRYLFGDFELDLGTFRLLRSGEPVFLEPKALDLLRLLIEQAPQVVDKNDIFRIVWKDVAVTDNALTRLIAQLRRALQDDARAPRYIETAATRGYRFVAEVRTPAPASTVSAVTSDRRSFVAAGLVALALGAWGFWTLAGPARTSTVQRPSTPDFAAFPSLRPRQLTAATGFDGFLSYAPDGKSYAYSSDRSGALEIYVQGVTPGSTASRLTNSGRHNIQPVWSPDGQLIAYHEMAGNGLWIIPSRGGVARKVSDFGAYPAFSPDGRKLAFQSLPAADLNHIGRPGVPSTIWTVDIAGSSRPVQVTRAGEPAGPHLTPVWWCDSLQLIFAVARPVVSGGTHALWIVASDGGSPRQMIAHDKLSAQLAMGPNCAGLYFNAAGTSAVWWLPLSDTATPAGEPRPTGLPLSGNINYLNSSADGHFIGWTVIDSASHVWAADIGPDWKPRGAARALTRGMGVRYGLPVASSDGRIALVGGTAGGFNSLYLLNSDLTLKQVTSDPPHHGGPRWMPDEKEIAYVTDHGQGPGFWAVQPDTGRERLLFALSSVPKAPGRTQPSTAAPSTGISFTRDFSRMAVAVVQNGTPNVWVARLQDFKPTGALVQRTFESDGGSYPAWSPDGHWIAYQCSEGTDTHICVTGGESGSRVQLTHDAGQSWVGGWVSDGDRILFAARRDAVWNVAAVSRSTDAVQVLTSFTEPRMYVRYPKWDEANKRVLVERTETTGRIWSVELPSE